MANTISLYELAFSTQTAGESITRLQCVYVRSNARFGIALANDTAKTRVVGIALQNASLGESCEVKNSGALEDASWTWTPGSILYLGNDGYLTDQAPLSPSTQIIVAIANTSTRIELSPIAAYSMFVPGINIQDVSLTSSAGSSENYAREDHQHNHNQLAGGDLHAIADASANTHGFMSHQDKEKLDSINDAPVGTIVMYASNVTPVGWFICDGTEKSRSTYADLFAVTGTKFGAGDGVNTFNVPNFQGRIPIGVDPTQTSTPDLSDLGKIDGNFNKDLRHTHQLEVDQKTTTGPSSFTDVQSGVGASVATDTHDHDIPQFMVESSVAGSPSESVLNPVLTFNFIIKF